MNFFMQEAVKQSLIAQKNDDVPVGAVIVCNNKIIAKSHNKKEKSNDATNHAEILAISKACKKRNSWHLDDCELYCTMEPCMMCCGAIIQSRIKKVYYLVKNEKFGCTELLKNSKIEVVEIEDIFDMKYILNNFFKNKR